jgi:nucleotide-binding universal stress UspA family protein
VRAASVLARLGRGRLLLVHVERRRTLNARVGRAGRDGRGRLRTRRVLRRALREVDPRVPTETELRYGDAAEELLAAADAVDAELLVLGTRGRRPVNATLLGSVTRTAMRRATRPVLVTPRFTPGRES